MLGPTAYTDVPVLASWDETPALRALTLALPPRSPPPTPGRARW